VDKVCDALALGSIQASLLARLVAKFGRPLVHIELALAPVAFLSASHGACTIDFALILWRSLNFFNKLRVRIGVITHFVALCGEEGALSLASVERNALTMCIILARTLARVKVSLCAVRQIDLALGHVALLAN